MTLFRTVDPLGEPVTLVEAKAHLRIDHASEDDLLAGLIRAARDEVEAATGIAMIGQHWRLTLDRVPADGMIELKRGPVVEITGVTGFDTDGAATLIDPATYIVDAHRRPADFTFVKTPATDRVANGIEIDFKAGYGESGAEVPDGLKRAILVLVAHWYEFRAGFGPSDQPVSWPAGFDRLVGRWKPGRL